MTEIPPGLLHNLQSSKLHPVQLLNKETLSVIARMDEKGSTAIETPTMAKLAGIPRARVLQIYRALRVIGLAEYHPRNTKVGKLKIRTEGYILSPEGVAFQAVVRELRK